MREQRVNHTFLLIDLDRVDRGVAAMVVVALHRAVERATQLVYAVLQDTGKAYQHWQREVVRGELTRKRVQVESLVGARVGAHGDVALRVDVEVAVAPVGDVISVACALDGPGHVCCCV